MLRRSGFLYPVLLCATTVAEPPATRSCETVYRQAAVATDHPVASQAGADMLRRGGNAIDAAVAASFCLSVVRPYSCGIGGGGFMLIHVPGEGGDPPLQVAINYRETAPAAVDRDYYARLGEPTAAHSGPRSVGVPGTVAGLLWALEHYGTLDRGTVLGPAIRAAELGFVADAHHVEVVSSVAERLETVPGLRQDAGFLWEILCRGGAVNEHDVLRNPGQARALSLIAEGGRAAFYEGPIANAIVKAMEARGGPITRADLSGYRLRVTQPLRGEFRGVEVLAMPPPSSGGVTMLQILGLLERRLDDLGQLRHNNAAYVHLLAESMKHAFADRAAWLADADFVDVPTGRLLSQDHLDRRASMISMSRTQDRRFYGSAVAPVRDDGTSHLSVIDAQGMAVACSETINRYYGSLVVVPEFGFALNDEMDDFTTVSGRPNEFELLQSDRNLPEPGKRPLSSMSPMIVLDQGRPVLVAGASGGPRIITATLQAVLNCLLFDMRPVPAVEAARFHHQWTPDVLEFEPRWEDRVVIAAIEELGHETRNGTSYASVQLIRIDPDGIRAASDPRKGGAPAGY